MGFVMSAFGFNSVPSNPGATPSHRWGWFIGLGILQIIVGVLCWIDVVAASIAATVVIGALLLLGGSSRSSRLSPCAGGAASCSMF